MFALKIVLAFTWNVPYVAFLPIFYRVRAESLDRDLSARTENKAEKSDCSVYTSDASGDGYLQERIFS